MNVREPLPCIQMEPKQLFNKTFELIKQGFHIAVFFALMDRAIPPFAKMRELLKRKVGKFVQGARTLHRDVIALSAGVGELLEHSPQPQIARLPISEVERPGIPYEA